MTSTSPGSCRSLALQSRLRLFRPVRSSELRIRCPQGIAIHHHPVVGRAVRSAAMAAKIFPPLRRGVDKWFPGGQGLIREEPDFGNRNQGRKLHNPSPIDNFFSPKLSSPPVSIRQRKPPRPLSHSWAPADRLVHPVTRSAFFASRKFDSADRKLASHQFIEVRSADQGVSPEGRTVHRRQFEFLFKLPATSSEKKVICPLKSGL